MDKKKKITMKKVFATLAFLCAVLCLHAQDVRQIQFCDKKYEYGAGKDSITLFVKVLDSDGNRSADVTVDDLEKYLVVYEDEKTMIPNNRRTIRSLSSGQRIPSDYTFSVLVDLSIPEEGKSQIYDVVGKLVESAPDSCVYLSFFGDEVTSTQLVTKENYKDNKRQFLTTASNKYFYGALYAKLAEFGGGDATLEETVKKQTGYTENKDVQRRAQANKDKNILFIFTEGNKRPEDETVSFVEVTSHQENRSHIVPRIYAFYYTGNGIDENVELTLKGVTSPRDAETGSIIEERRGDYKPSDDLSSVLDDFEQVVKDAMYDFAYTYQAMEGKVYAGRTTYIAEWKGDRIGRGTYSIGAVENPWPTRVESVGDIVTKLLMAILITLLTIIVFFIIIKVLIPLVKSRIFAMKYYKKYEPEANVRKRVCHYCSQEILPGQMVVKKCEHIMHVRCWEQNGYKCAEYGQGCKTGIQEHVDWNQVMSKQAFRDCYQSFAGIVAGFVSWLIYELMGRGSFTAMASGIVNTFFMNEAQKQNLSDTCVTKVSALLTIGLLLGFFLSLIFRYNDEYRKKDAKIYLKIVGLSVLSGLIGMVAFAIGAVVFCLLLSAVGTTYIPWYCSLPAYLLFSVCVSLSLTIQSSIPVRSALIGGLCSAVIGFFVLYFSSTGSGYGWTNMLLDFIIYGGGLGASLVTVRMLAEKYFLVIQNGMKAGQKIPIHKWMNATGGGNKVSIGMTGECEIQMNWEKSNLVAKEHAQLYIDHDRNLPMIKALATGIIYNTRTELSTGKPEILSNGDTFKIGDTIFQYVETE